MSQPSIKLVQYPGLKEGETMSPFCGKVHMALRYKKLDYDVIDLQSPYEAKKYNPRGRVPVLLLDGTATVDSSDIIDELERRFPDPPLEPTSARDRAQVKVYEDWADEVLYFYGVWLRWIDPEGFAAMKRHMISKLAPPMKWIVPMVAKRITGRRAFGQGVGLKDRKTVRTETRQCLQALSDLLDGRSFLVGDGLTRADLSVCAIIDQLSVEQLTPWVAQEIRSLPNITAWQERVHQLAPDAC